MLHVGDRVQFMVRGDDREIAVAVIDALRDDSAVAEQMVPTPVGLEVVSGEFGDVNVVHDFIVAIAAGITVEGLVAAVRQALGKASGEKHSPLCETTLSVSVKTEAAGIVEVEITTYQRTEA